VPLEGTLLGAPTQSILVTRPGLPSPRVPAAATLQCIVRRVAARLCSNAGKFTPEGVVSVDVVLAEAGTSKVVADGSLAAPVGTCVEGGTVVMALVGGWVVGWGCVGGGDECGWVGLSAGGWG
jgi:hypothetical protein